jgi:hypothetical protein
MMVCCFFLFDFCLFVDDGKKEKKALLRSLFVVVVEELDEYFFEYSRERKNKILVCKLLPFCLAMCLYL